MLHKWRNKLEKTEVQINEEEIGKLPEEDFIIMIVKMIKNLENKMEKLQESINKDPEELKNKHTETNNTNTEIKKYSRRNQYLKQKNESVSWRKNGGNNFWRAE